MTKPDWSKAPEGATHYHPSSGDWYRLEEGEPALVLHQSWAKSEMFDYRKDDLVPVPIDRQWRGPEDGLPPVGTVCEVCIYPRGWTKVHVVYIGRRDEKLCAVVQAADAMFFCEEELSVFRPIKTQEQKDEEARNDAIIGMMADCSLRNMDVAKKIFGELYDAGYRKP